MALTEADAGGLEAVYEALSEMEDAIVLVLESGDGFTAVCGRRR